MITFRRITAVLVSSLALLPAAASAEEEAFSLDDFLASPREYAIEEIATDLAYGFCPLYLVGQFPLTDNPKLQERGFGDEVVKMETVKGEFQQVTVLREDGEVGFGGTGLICNVTVTGPKREAALDKLRTSMSYMGIDLQPSPEDSGIRGGVAYETFKGPVDGQTLYVELARIEDDNPLISAQLYVMAE